MDTQRIRRIGAGLGIGLVVLLVLGGLVGLAGRNSGDSLHTVGAAISDGAASGSGAPATTFASADAAARDEMSDTAPAPSAKEGEAAAVGSGSFTVPMVRTGSIDIEIDDADDLAKAVDQVLAVVPEGGYVERSSSSTDSASITLRVPATAYDTTIAAVRGLGRVVGSTTDAQDVSGEVVDLNARLTILEAQRASLEQILSQSRNPSEIGSLRSQLFSVQEEIERINGRRQMLDRQVNLATLTVSVALPGAIVEPVEASPSTLAVSWDRAVAAGATVIGGTIVLLGVLVPLALVSAPLWIGFLLWRRHQRRGGGTPAVA